jgi:hypothetical protein
MAKGTWHVHHGVVRKQPGSAPNDPGTFTIDKLLQLQVSGHSNEPLA